MTTNDDFFGALQLLQSFNAKRADGTFRFPEQDVKDFLAVILLHASQERPLSLPPYYRQLLGEFAVRIGFVGTNAHPDKLQRLVGQYLTKHPLNPALLHEFKKTAGLKFKPQFHLSSRV